MSRAAMQLPKSAPELVGGRLRLASSRTALVLGSVLLVLAAARPPLVALAHQWSVFTVGTPLIIELPYAVVGFVIAWRQPRNPVGWIILASGGLSLLSGDCGEYAWIVYSLGHRGLPLGELAVFFSIGGFLLFGLIPIAMLLFPSGRLPPWPWRWVLFANLAAVAAWGGSAVVVTLVDILEHGVQRVDDPTGGGIAAAVVDRPAGWFATVISVMAPVLAVCWLLAAARQFTRWRGASGALRQQIKCLLVGIAICLVAAVILASGTAGGGASLAQQVWSQVPWIAFSAFPLSIGLGILKYRLYEIDRLVSRTISYLILTALLIGVFAGIVLVATHVLPFSSPVAVAASTLAAAALFNPLRRRVQSLVDRRFNRTRYDAEATVAALTAKLRDAVDLETVEAGLLDGVQQALAPTHASLWIKPAKPAPRA